MATTSIGAPGVVFPDSTTQATAANPNVVTTIYRSPSPWTKPATIRAVRVTVLSGGGGGAGVKGQSASPTQGGGGGGGAGGVGFFPAASIPGPQTISVGAGGTGGTAPAAYGGIAPGTAGGTSSFGSLITATGGGAGTSGVGATGAITSGPQVQGYTGTPAEVAPSGTAGSGGDSYQSQGFGGVPYLGPGLPATKLSGGPGTGYGAGGGGSWSPSGPLPSVGTLGGNGSVGYVIVEEFY